ncbi:phage tail tip fiber protein [Stutzerimonas nitrititolerans]|uniref:phage tail tip fiber protein n=1 Tax=Stutzerimonas nitrititolerans TaxID=2482751 RepID=UPI0028B21998|nr:DUF1983 domain-containing protein [Stutzerimonas nitrititolerans]
MPPVVIAIAAGAAAAAAGATVIGALAVAAIAGGLFAMMKQAEPSMDGYTAEPASQTLRSSKAAARYVVGRVATGGVLMWAQEQAGSQDDGEWLHLVYCLSEGSIESVEQILLNDSLITSYGSHAGYEVIINPTTPNAYLLANCPDWRDSMIGTGLSFVRVSLKYSNEVYPSGIPDAKFVCRGRTDIYDPRTGNTGYSENPALIALWYLRTVLGVPDDELVLESFIDSANICAETVSNPGGGSSIRYTMGAVIGDDERRGDVLKKIEAACAGKISRVGGRWMMRVGAYYGPGEFTVTEDMVIGAVQGTVEVDNDSAINTVTGIFNDPTTWTETDYPPVQSALWLSEDGEELSETLDLKYVTNPYQAQRLADIVLRSRRNGGGLKLPLNFAGFNCRPGRPIQVELPSLNLGGEFIVTDWSMSGESACTVTVEPYDPEIYDDAAGREYTPIGYIDVPTGGVAPPTGLLWTPDREPEVRQGVLNWVLPFGEISYSGIVIRNPAGEAVQTYQVPGSASLCQVQGLPVGNYTFSVFCASANGRSAEATISVSIQGPPQPQSVSVQEGFDAITLIPFNVTGLNGGTYEYWYSLTPTENPEAAIFLGRGGSFTHSGLAYNTVYHYYVRSVNAYGVSAFYYQQAQTTNDPSLILELIKGQITETELGDHLLGEIDKISGNGPGSVNERIQDAVSQAVDALAYDPDQAYAQGDAVRGGPNGRRLYQALVDVPAAPDGGNAPPNDNLWMDVGQVVETANGLAVQVAENTAGISVLDGIVTATASSLAVLQAAYRDDDGEGELADALKGWDSAARITQVARTVATENMAMAEQINQLDATVGDTSAVVQQTSQALVDLKGKASALTTIKTQTTVDGRTVMAGLAIGVEGEEQESQILAFAQRFAILDESSGELITPFVVQGGQIFANSAVFNQADIVNLIVTGELRSSDYVEGQQGIRINFVTNEFEVNGSVPGEGRITINNKVITAYHPNGVKGLEFGIGG